MRPINDDLTADYVRSILRYNKQTGNFTWRHRADLSPQWNGRLAGKTAGVKTKRYVIITINDRPYQAHRLAWLMVTGGWPVGQLDHKNTVKHDNRFSNLRPALPSDQQGNVRRSSRNSTGFKGVCWSKYHGKFQANITKNKKSYFIGRFDTAQKAHSAYREAANRLFKEFARSA